MIPIHCEVCRKAIATVEIPILNLHLCQPCLEAIDKRIKEMVLLTPRVLGTPRTAAAATAIGRSGVDWHHSATLMRRYAETLEEELNALAFKKPHDMYWVHRATAAEASNLEWRHRVDALRQEFFTATGRVSIH